MARVCTMNTNNSTNNQSTELTTQQRIMILEDVLKKLESFDINGGLCYKIKCSAFELFQIQEDTNANEIIPLFTFENAKMVTDVVDRAHKEFYWWNYVNSYDLQNRIKFVKWMINEELTNNCNG